MKAYLSEKGKPTNFEDLSEDDLAITLSQFYLNVRTKDGELYKSKSLESIRYALNRYLKSPPHSKKFDIITGAAFVDANQCYKVAQTDIKKAGKGSVDHFQMISKNDIQKLYQSIYLSPETPSGLLNRVQMNVRLFFCRRANENMENMTKDTFKVSSYDDGTKYVVKSVDELTKNHRMNDREIVSGHMPEDKDNARVCPVRTFQLYLSKLNPACNRLWQYPKDSFNESDDTWYQNKAVRKKCIEQSYAKVEQLCIPVTKLHESLCQSDRGKLAQSEQVQRSPDYGYNWSQICLYPVCVPESNRTGETINGSSDQ